LPLADFQFIGIVSMAFSQAMEFIPMIFEERDRLNYDINAALELKEFVAEMESKYWSLHGIHLSGKCTKKCLEISWSQILEHKILVVSLQNAYQVDLSVSLGDRHEPRLQDESLLSISKAIFPVYKKIIQCYERHRRYFSGSTPRTRKTR